MVFAASGLPFLGFGFLDNFLMIVFGEMIDGTLCVALNFSTMAAAAIGNTISDVAGIFSGGAVENLARRVGVEEPELEMAQRIMPVTKAYQYSGQVVGIVIGCTLGCCPLLWIDPKESERLKRAKEREAVFESVIKKVKQILNAEAVGLLLVDKERGDLVSTHQSLNLPNSFRWKNGEGFIGHVAATGKFVNVADTKEEPNYDPAIHDNLLGTGIKVQSILCMPIYRQGKVDGVITVINKQGKEGIFTQKDEDVLSAICSHISVALEDDKQHFEEVIEICEKSMSTTGCKEWSSSAASQRMASLYEPALEGLRNALGAEATALMLLDQPSQELYTEVIHGPLPPHRTAVGEGVTGQAVATGKIANVDGRNRGGWFNAERHKNYHGTGMEVSSQLVVPLFDTSRKCLGAIKCINKHDAPAFGEEDIEYVSEVAQHIEMMLEGPDAGLRRVLALSRKRMQLKDVIAAGDLGQMAVLCHLERAQSLPCRLPKDAKEAKSTLDRKKIDPYITFSIARGNPLLDPSKDMERRIRRARNQDRKAAVRRYAKSNTILQDESPQWDETIALALPERFRDAPPEELYVHVLLWDYDTLTPDDLVAQTAFPLGEMSTSASKATPHKLHPIPGNEGVYDLSEARIWVSFSRGAHEED